MNSVQDVKILVCQLFDARESYREAKDLAEARSKKVTAIEAELLDVLEKSGLDSFEVPKIGKVTVNEKESYQTPKTIDDKKAFFKFLLDRYGHDAYWSYMTINSQSLQSLAKQFGEEGEVVIPGLSLPTKYNKLSVRTSRK